MRDAAIHARGLRKSFGATQVLDGVDLTVPAGSLLALLGPNGSGKTTTVRILATLLAPDGGTAAVGGHDVVREGAAVRRSIGLTAQHATVDDLLTGKENLELFAGLYHLGRRAARRRAAELLDRFDLTTAADRLAGTYSGGMRRRLDLAASMVAAPRILFLDEPTTGLDPRSRAELWTVIRELLASGTTILLTTQYLEEADRLADRIAVIHGGRIVADDAPAALKHQMGSERLTLRLARPEDVSRAGAALSAGAEDGTGIRLDADTREVALAVHDPDHLRRTLDLLHREGITVEQADLRTPTLDDVFFELTEAAA
ncbi:daunorubicin resistance protein DrrA family ABC transporter ATP-binding protein [Planomonospora parontospora subsp. parontospora]|uniref:Daunorubicin resistance protein DrrA family ABC transporter ATP-binding protein n=2 Tax=Planomonospora parontospora TaxID=58119 RepID=A0AA37BHE9_9ACTN|nr:ATP-binding cassette domain-containing protein [Planomonospora parontospora]GGK70882.1 daunorubicin resistance protein DrrA family ABC transporter ATP-binding protein [Planomonospora parontospora]GII09749.1 daunorubicin resistance protein DrrA family ABC transporter ATP-binding protein [Planomonospora parontospora subsp. parontospora]